MIGGIKMVYTVHFNAGEWWWEEIHKFDSLKELEEYLKAEGKFSTVEKITW